MRGELQHALECECCSKSADILHDFLAESDALVAKALKLSEIAQIAKTEQRMRELLLGRWRLRAAQAAVSAGRAITSGGSIATALGRVDKIMAKWDDDVALRYARDLEDVYKLARTAGWKKATKQTTTSLGYDIPNFTETLPEEEIKKAKPGVAPVFDLYDKSAIAALHDDQMLWIGSHYDKNVSVSIRAATTQSVIAGQGRIEAGRTMEKHVRDELGKVNVPKGFHGSDAKYMEGLAANAATVARVRGQIRSFQDAGITRYEVVNPNDRRTSPQCQHMSGKVFTVKHAVEQIESEAGATKPDDIKKAHPWMSIGEMKKVSPKAGHVGGKAGAADSAALAAQGASLPTYHFRCRSTVDISVEAGSWESLSPAEVKVQTPPMPPRPPPKPVKPTRPTTTPKPTSAAARAATIPPAIGAGLPVPATEAEVAAYFGEVNPAIQGMGPTVSPAIHTENARKLRESTRRMFKQRYGITPVFEGNESVTVIVSEKTSRQMGVRGMLNTDTGRLTLSKDTFDGARLHSAQQAAKQADKTLGDSFRTVIHEELHHASKKSVQVLVGPGKFVEETTTEIAARVISADLGVLQKNVGISFPTASRGWRVVGAYDFEISTLLDEVTAATKWSGDKVLAGVQEAAIAMRRPGAKALGYKAHVENFVDNIPGISATQRKDLISRLGFTSL